MGRLPQLLSLSPTSLVTLMGLASVCIPLWKLVLTSTMVVPESRCRRAALVLLVGMHSVSVILMGILLKSGYLMGLASPSMVMFGARTVLSPVRGMVKLVIRLALVLPL